MLTMHKIPLRASPILHLKDRLLDVNHPRTAAIVPTNRNLRRLASCAGWEIDIQTVSEFTRRANLYTNILLPKELRKYYLYKAAKSLSAEDQSTMLHSREPDALKSYIHFIQSSSELLPFYRELSVEGISSDKLKAESLYHDYEEQVEVLTGLWQIYTNTARGAGFADEWEYYAAPSLDADYLARYDNYFFLIGGYLNNYEITQLKSIAENRRVDLYFNYTEETHYQKEKLEKAFGTKMNGAEDDRPLKWRAIENDTDLAACAENSEPALVYHNQDKIRAALKSRSGGTAVTEIRPCATVIEQFELITRRICELHFAEGIPMNKIAVVLPAPELAPLFLNSDPYSLYNVSAGRPVSSYIFHETLTALREMLAGESKGKIPLELLEQFLASPCFSKRGVKTFLDRINEMRKGGAIYINKDAVPGFNWAGVELLRAMVIPFTAQYMTYDECLRAVAKILETIRPEATEEETEGILKTVDEIEKMRLLYRHITEEFPSTELLRTVLDELAPLGVAVSKGEVSVLGLLESRNMQYDYLFIPGMNSENFPARQGKDLFLNSELRIKLELPTAAAREALQKGYCHQITARAKYTVITYSAGEENQPSSFIQELLNSAGALVKEQAVHKLPYEASNSILFPSAPYKAASGSEDIIKDDDAMDQIKSFTFSATSLNCYRNCPLQFFYRYIKKLRECAGTVDDIDMRVVGIVMHSVMETLFREGISASDKRYLGRMNSIFDEKTAGYDYFTTNPIGIFHAGGIKNSFPLLAEQEKERLESGAVIQEYEGEIRGEMYGFRFKGQIDRWDRTPEGYDIIDYKYKKLEELKQSEDPEAAGEEAADPDSFVEIDLQLPLYALMMEMRHGAYPENMLWFDLKGGQGFISGFHKESLDGFKIYLEKLMADVAEPEVPFRNARKADTCKYCEYKTFCRRCLI